jgi:dTMP kinase
MGLAHSCSPRRPFRNQGSQRRFARMNDVTHLESRRRALQLRAHSYRGQLIAICGVDGAGKTTLIEGLAAGLREQGREVVSTRQPTTEARRHPLFERYLFHPEERSRLNYLALLAAMLSDRLQHVHEVIAPSLERGATVISDRYVFTMIAAMRARGWDEEWALSACRHILKPDIAVLVDVPVDVAITRISTRTGFRESYLETDLLDRLVTEFRNLADEGHLVRLSSVELSRADLLDKVTELSIDDLRQRHSAERRASRPA